MLQRTIAIALLLTGLLLASCRRGDEDPVMYYDLVSTGADKPVRLSEIYDDPYGDALAVAILKGDDAELRRLLGHRTGVHTTGSHGITPLWIAISRHNDTAVEILLAEGADPNAQFDWVEPCLITALSEVYPHRNKKASIKILDLLLTHGADPNVAFENDGKTNPAIFYTSDSKEVLQKLLNEGADINTPDAYGISLLMASITRAQVPFLLDLLDLGADPTIVSKDGITFIKLVDIWLRRNPEDKAAFEPVFRKLKEKGYDVGDLRRQAAETGWEG